jgi:hypothetical protein
MLLFFAILGTQGDDTQGEGTGAGAEAEEGVEMQELSQASHVILEDGFKPELVTALRGVFDARFAGVFL